MQGVYVRRIAYGFLVVMTLINLFPIVWLLISSTKPEIEMFQVPPTIVPRTPSLENYEVALFKKPFLHYLMNSAVIVLSATLLSTMTAAIAAYGLSRYRFPGSRLFVVFLLIVRMIPGIAILVPMFVLMKNLNLVDTYLC